MTSTALPYMPSKITQEAILQFSKQAFFTSNQQLDMRERLRKIDLEYIREIDFTSEQFKAAMANSQGDVTKFQNIVMPVIMPQVENAVTYQSSVFLQGVPIFGCVSQPGMQDIALQIDSIIQEQQIRGQWVSELTQAIRDGFKYNLMGVEIDWQRQKSFAPDSRTENEVIWEGNRIKRLDLYNTFWDTRVKPTEVARYGEYAGFMELMSRIRLKQFIQELPYNMNVTAAFESGTGNVNTYGNGGYANYFIPQINPEAFVDTNLWYEGQTNWLAWAGLENNAGSNINYKDMYVVTTLYGRIMPSEFSMRGIPGQQTPQVWKFIVVNNEVIIYAERLTNAHGLIPMLFAQPLNDGLGYQTKSFAKNLSPIQAITTALANSDIAARRRAISDRIIYDATKISPAAINNDSPNARIPARPSASGQAISSLVHQFPFEDSQFQFNAAAMQQYFNYANIITGLNPARQGQFVKGNKTRYEFAEVMGNANGRDQAVAMSLETDWFTPMKEILKVNILQYQGGTTIFNQSIGSNVDIDPVALRTAQFRFKISDGLIPSEKLIDADTMQQLLQAVMAAPALASEYNLGPMVSYLAKSGGADIGVFEKSDEQKAYEQAMAAWQQTAQMITEQIIRSTPKDSPVDFQGLQQALPPQPKPEQFGYVPGKPNLASKGVDKNGNSMTLLQQVSQATMQDQSSEGAPSSQPNGQSAPNA